MGTEIGLPGGISRFIELKSTQLTTDLITNERSRLTKARSLWVGGFLVGIVLVGVAFCVKR